MEQDDRKSVTYMVMASSRGQAVDRAIDICWARQGWDEKYVEEVTVNGPFPLGMRPEAIPGDNLNNNAYDVKVTVWL